MEAGKGAVSMAAEILPFFLALNCLPTVGSLRLSYIACSGLSRPGSMAVVYPRAKESLFPCLEKTSRGLEKTSPADPPPLIAWLLRCLVGLGF